jgi:hypothetical protein
MKCCLKQSLFGIKIIFGKFFINVQPGGSNDNRYGDHRIVSESKESSTINEQKMKAAN